MFTQEVTKDARSAKENLSREHPLHRRFILAFARYFRIDNPTGSEVQDVCQSDLILHRFPYSIIHQRENPALSRGYAHGLVLNKFEHTDGMLWQQ